MTDLIGYLLVFSLVLNLAGFIVCGMDKSRAKRGRWRLSERALLLVGLCGGCFGLLVGMGVFRHKTRHRKFQIAVPLECALWAVILIHLISAITLDRQIDYREISYRSPGVPEALRGYTVAFVTDTHALPAEQLREVADRIGAYAPDLLLLGGDFPSAPGAAERSIAILSDVQTADGIYGVEGNHDDWRELFAAMERYAVTPLSNSGVSIRDGLYLAGVEDLWNRTPDIAKAIEGAGEADFILLLAHNPDVTMQQDTARVGLTFSGHTHGGQITLFGKLAPALEWSGRITEYGRRFLSGWAKSRDGTDVLVSNGTGCLTGVPRIFARPQVLLVTLEPGEASYNR